MSLLLLSPLGAYPDRKIVDIMKTLLATLTAAAVLAAAGLIHAQSPSVQKMEGIWIFRGNFPGQSQPAYTGTAHFRPDGTFSGPPIDQRSGPAIGEWYRSGDKEFAFTFVANTYDEAGAFRTTNRVRGMMAISEDGRLASGRTILDVFDSAGQILLTRNATFTGSRVVVEPF